MIEIDIHSVLMRRISPDLYEHGGVFILGALLYDNLTPPLGPLME